MLRLACRSATAAAAGARTIVQVTSCSPVFEQHAEARKYPSIVWIEKADAWWYEKITKPREGEQPTTAQVPARIELYNIDQLQSKVEPPLEALGHFSLKTKKRYSGGFQQVLDDFARVNRFDSKWWLSGAEARKQNLRLRVDARPCVQIINKTAEFFNASQFENPAAIAMHAFSGATGRAYGDATGATMTAHAEENGFESAIYFTQRQLSSINIDLPVGKPLCEVHTSRNGAMMLFPVEEVQDGERFLKSLNRYPVDVPTYALSGQPLAEDLKALAAAMPIKSNYWVSEAEVTRRGFAMRPKAKGIAPGGSQGKFTAVNLHQLSPEDQLKAGKHIGRFM